MRLLTLLLTLLCCITPALAQNTAIDTNSFKQIPILHEGRIKPIDSFARLQLKNLTGSETWQGLNATEWLIRTLFDPTSEQDQILTIKDPDVKKLLNLPADQKYFSLHDIAPALDNTAETVYKLATQEDQSTLSPAQKNLIKLHENAATLHDLSRSLSLLTPLHLTEDETDLRSYRDHKLAYNNSKSQLITIIQDKGQNPEKYNDQEKTIALFTFQMDQIRLDGNSTQMLRVLPIQNEQKEWVSPWHYEEHSEPNKKVEKLLKYWQAMNTAYHNNKADDWNKAATDLLKQFKSQNPENYSPALIQLEIIYNDVHPFNGALIFYLLTLISLGIGLIFIKKPKEQERPPAPIKQKTVQKEEKPKEPPQEPNYLSPFWLWGNNGFFPYNRQEDKDERIEEEDLVEELEEPKEEIKKKPTKNLTIIKLLPTTALAIATLCLIIGILMRMTILGRPPVSTLYESTLFVTAIASILGLIMAHKQKDNLITLITALLGTGLMLLAPILIKDGDSMEMLVAVLNTNFWLATHVVCITMGYGVSILAATLAHITLGMHCTSKSSKQSREAMLSNSYKAALGALLLTAVGTVLGGIWADQSWGRFWGWDPKENGALLIVLWLIWILHGRMSGHLKALGFSALLAALNIVVAITWFGVNLLGVGLHSYGFTSGLATGLFIVCALETLLIAALTFIANKKRTS